MNPAIQGHGVEINPMMHWVKGRLQAQNDTGLRHGRIKYSHLRAFSTRSGFKLKTFLS